MSVFKKKKIDTEEFKEILAISRRMGVSKLSWGDLKLDFSPVADKSEESKLKEEKEFQRQFKRHVSEHAIADPQSFEEHLLDDEF